MTQYDHVVLISIDTLRADCFGLTPTNLWRDRFGDELPYDSTILDAIAGEGAFFSKCITAAPYTSASHATFFTGQWPPRHGLYELFNRRLRSATVFADARRAGYTTHFKVDFPLILGRDLGFLDDVQHSFVEDDDAPLRVVRDSARSFGFVHFGGVHTPYGFHNLRFGGDDYREKVAELEAELPGMRRSPVDRLIETQREGDDLALLIRYKRITQYLYETGAYRRLFELYLEGVQYFMKRRFARFYDHLTSALRGRRALIVIFGDHGEDWDAETYGHHNSVAEGVTRVPLLFIGDGIQAARYTGRVRSVDLVPTLCALTGIRRRTSADGVSLAETVRSGAQYVERDAYCQTYSAETADFVRFQQRQLLHGRKTGSLRHVRYKEAAYHGDLKLARQFFAMSEAGGIWGLQACPVVRRLDRIDAAGRLHEIADPGETELDGMLDRYNAIIERDGLRRAPLPLDELARASARSALR